MTAITLKLIFMAITVIALVYLEDRYKSKPTNKERTLAYILLIILILIMLFTTLVAINNIFTC